MSRYIGHECPHCREEIEDHDVYERVVAEDFGPAVAKGDSVPVPNFEYETERVIELGCGHVMPHELFVDFNSYAKKYNEITRWLDRYDGHLDDRLLNLGPMPSLAREAIGGQLTELNIKMGRIADQCSQYIEDESDQLTADMQ